MARIVLANEMGGGWGHLLPLRSIAEEFVQRGCKVSLLCREPGRREVSFRGMGVAIEPSPAWTLRNTGFSLNYAQNLWGNGYWDDEMLGAPFHVVVGQIQDPRSPTSFLRITPLPPFCPPCLLTYRGGPSARDLPFPP